MNKRRQKPLYRASITQKKMKNEIDFLIEMKLTAMKIDATDRPAHIPAQRSGVDLKTFVYVDN